MAAYRAANWAPAIVAALAVAGGGLVVLGGVSHQQPGWGVVLGAGVAALLMAAGLMYWTAVVRVRRDARRRELRKYACPRCGYTPDPGQLEDAPAMPCPRCGQSVYIE